MNHTERTVSEKKKNNRNSKKRKKEKIRVDVADVPVLNSEQSMEAVCAEKKVKTIPPFPNNTDRQNVQVNREKIQGSSKARPALPVTDSVLGVAPKVSETSVVHLSDVSFRSLDISNHSLRALTEVMNYEMMTKVQNETLPIVLLGKDLLAKSKTGTGKTIAFLLPTVETLGRSVRSSKGISALVLSPTRELASQIEVEAKKLTTYHAISVACVVGGTSINKDLCKLRNPSGIDILVATPGRLQDHLRNNNGNIVDRLKSIQVLVLDEADRLLDMGFRPDIESILQFLPTGRQTLLFSATLPASLDNIKRLALKHDHVFVDTVGEENQTNAQVNQSVMVCPFDEHILVLEALLQDHIQSATDGYKIMVFFPTARCAGFMATVFLKAGFSILEMHSRKSQSHRTRTAEIFRMKDNVILFSSDVSARGVDYPGVSFVVQVGLTDREQYIHRLGRTGRAGKEGQGALLICDFEKPFLQELLDLPLVSQTAITALTQSKVDDVLGRVNLENDLRLAGEQAYQAWLGYYNSNLRRLKLTKIQLVSMAEEYSRVIGLKEVPALLKKIIGKMGLQNMGLRIKANS